MEDYLRHSAFCILNQSQLPASAPEEEIGFRFRIEIERVLTGSLGPGLSGQMVPLSPNPELVWCPIDIVWRKFVLADTCIQRLRIRLHGDSRWRRFGSCSWRPPPLKEGAAHDDGHREVTVETRPAWAAIRPRRVPMSKAGSSTTHKTRLKTPKWDITRERTGATAIAPNHSVVITAARAQRGTRSLPPPTNTRKTVAIAAACAAKYRGGGIASTQNPVVRTKATIRTVATSNPRPHAHGRGSCGKQSAKPAAPAKPSTIPASRQRHEAGAAGGALPTAAHAASTAAFTSSGS